MPLSPATSRKLLHLRDVQLRGYEREDGLVDIEARITDVKTYSWSNRFRDAAAGDPLHDMWMRITLDRDMVIHECEASTEAAPYEACPNAAPNFARLAGLVIGKGFLRAAMQRVGGVEGCTHLRELLQPLATVAFQTMVSVRNHNAKAEQEKPLTGLNLALVNSCLAYDENGAYFAENKARAVSET
jgi:hypothetical protein